MDTSQASDAARPQTDVTIRSFSTTARLTDPTVSGAVLEAIPDAVVMVNPDGAILYVNDQLERLFGYPRSALQGQPIEVLVPARFHAVHRRNRAQYGLQPHIRMMGVDLELSGRRQDGSEFPIEVSLFPLTAGAELLVIAFLRDITEKKHLQAVARAQAEQLTRTFEAMGDAVYIYDKQGLLVRLNAAARAISGYDTQPELMRETAGERLQRLQARDVKGHPLPPEAWPIQRVLQGEVIPPDVPVEFVITTAVGHEMIRHVTGAPLHDADERVVGAVLVTHDVTTQRHLERELAARAQEIERIFEAETDAVMVFDAAGRNVRMNAAYRRLYGYEASQQVEPVPPEERARQFVVRDTAGHRLPLEAWPITRVLHGETLTGSQVVELVLRTLDGRELVVSISGAPLVDADGQVLGGVLITQDVTEQRRLEQQRTDILRVVAHDLSSPMAAMKLMLQTEQRRQQRGLPARPMDAETLDSLGHLLGRAERLLADLRAVVSLEAGALSMEVQPCNLTLLCEREVDAERLESGRDIRLVVPDEPVHVRADPAKIGQVLANLLSNAVKYAPPEQPITVTVHIEPAAGQATSARVLVHDEGPGIPREEQPHIWERFHRTAGLRAQPGTGGSMGLGLYISREIVKRHGGTIGVRGSPGQGSTFWFALPLAAV
jgi:PAS domain S-box-containing protein